MENGIAIPNNLPRDDDQHISCSAFSPLPQLPVRSSSFSDLSKWVLGFLFSRVFNASATEVVSMADPEPLLMLYKQTIIQEEFNTSACLPNIIAAPPIFHLRKHGFEACFADDVLLRLIWAPYLHAIGFRENEYNKYLSESKFQDCNNRLLAKKAMSTKAHMRFDRLCSMMLTLFDAFVVVQPQLDARRYSTSGPVCKYLYEFFNGELRTWVMPYRSIVLGGQIAPLLSALPHMLMYICGYGKYKIARATAHILGLVDHWATHRPDILRLLGKNCKVLNDVHIEHQNSVLSRSVHHSNLTFPSLKRIAALVKPMREQIFGGLEENADEEDADDDSKLKEPEVSRTEHIHTDDLETMGTAQGFILQLFADAATYQHDGNVQGFASSARSKRLEFGKSILKNKWTKDERKYRANTLYEERKLVLASHAPRSRRFLSTQKHKTLFQFNEHVHAWVTDGSTVELCNALTSKFHTIDELLRCAEHHGIVWDPPYDPRSDYVPAGPAMGDYIRDGENIASVDVFSIPCQNK